MIVRTSWSRFWLAVVAGWLLLTGTMNLAEAQFVFRDVGDEAGLFPHVSKIAGHSAAWGDIDGDGWPDLYVSTFGGHPYDSKPNQLFRNVRGKFTLDEQPALRVLGRASGSVFADLDNDGDLDLYLSNHAIDAAAYKQPHYGAPNFLFRNDGGGRFTDVSAESGSRPTVTGDFAGRSVTVLDYDGDGLLDLLVGECIYQGGQGRTKLLRNLGGLKFQDVTAAVGLPGLATGLGVAATDVNGDGWPDLFIAGRDVLKAGRDPGNHLFINDGRGAFRELPKTHADFTWDYTTHTPDDTTCGVSIADVNRDGRPDILIGHHFSQPWHVGGVPVRLYLHRGIVDGLPKFEDITSLVGLKPLPMKAPHVEIQDFNNDGWPDISTPIVKFAGGKTYPVIFQNLGVEAATGVPRFREDALAVNDFPTPDDIKLAGTGEFFDKLEREKKIVYTAPGPSGDFDRDGRLDFFLANWWVTARSMLLKNETPGGHWLDVVVEGTAKPGASGVNRAGIGAVVRVYPLAEEGKSKALLGVREISSSQGYTSGQEPVAHFGLGTVEKCYVEVILPHGRGRWERHNVSANQRIVIKSVP